MVDRGPSSYLSNVDVFLDGHLITTVQGDGECSEPVLGSPGGFSLMETELKFTADSKHECAKNGCVHCHSEALGADRFC